MQEEFQIRIASVGEALPAIPPTSFRIRLFALSRFLAFSEDGKSSSRSAFWDHEIARQELPAPVLGGRVKPGTSVRGFLRGTDSATVGRDGCGMIVMERPEASRQPGKPVVGAHGGVHPRGSIPVDKIGVGSWQSGGEEPRRCVTVLKF